MCIEHKGREGEGGQGLEGEQREGEEGEKGKGRRGGERREGRTREGINLPHGHLKTLTALLPVVSCSRCRWRHRHRRRDRTERRPPDLLYWTTKTQTSCSLIDWQKIKQKHWIVWPKSHSLRYAHGSSCTTSDIFSNYERGGVTFSGIHFQSVQVLAIIFSH